MSPTLINLKISTYMLFFSLIVCMLIGNEKNCNECIFTNGITTATVLVLISYLFAHSLNARFTMLFQLLRKKQPGIIKQTQYVAPILPYKHAPSSMQIITPSGPRWSNTVQIGPRLWDC